MNIKIKRFAFKNTYTIGKLYVDEKYVCDTIEDVVREDGVKVYGKTAIPYGTYKVVMTYSPKFKRILPEILSVPNFSNIRIHSGNTEEDSLGCIIVGRNKEVGKVIDSKICLGLLLDKLKGETNITLEICQ